MCFLSSASSLSSTASGMPNVLEIWLLHSRHSRKFLAFIYKSTNPSLLASSVPLCLAASTQATHKRPVFFTTAVECRSHKSMILAAGCYIATWRWRDGQSGLSHGVYTLGPLCESLN
ncbi:hypothetical protein HGRIS_003959 [Hohenbuehelia grisea]|uniref:Uncharacterized protein n=1 Tax=Hohenbuehelia grisea TaxID=104357 RepID=A0ABR3JHI5_9AGAR